MLFRSVVCFPVTIRGEDYGRIHLHGIVWCPKERVKQWGYGYTYIGDYVNQKTIAYVTKYMLKICEKWPDFRGKVMCSAGIGSRYELSYNAKRNRYRGKETNETYKLEDGTELPLPKYYHDKIYTEEEREDLWIIKQERGYRYIAGEKVNQWGYGYTYIGNYVNQTTIAYVTKYMLKICEKWPDFRGKVMCSAGIGCRYETSYNAKRNVYRGKETKETYKLENGSELPLPNSFHSQ